MTNSSITQNADIFQRVKEVPFPEIFQAFHGGEMRRRGRFFVALCPFHNETNPSFTIYNNGYKCYSCSEAGDSISFVAKLLNLQPLEAAKAIAKEINIPIRDGPLSFEDKLRLAQAKAERLREKRLQQAFEEWCKEAGTRARVLAEAIKSVLDEKGVEVDEELLPIIHLLPLFEHWADTLNMGTDEERLELYRNPEIRRWIN